MINSKFLMFIPLLYLYLSCAPPGNKYGEPVVCGFARSFGQRLPNKERVEWIKPIMFTAGLGWLDSRHTVKGLLDDITFQSLFDKIDEFNSFSLYPSIDRMLIFILRLSQ